MKKFLLAAASLVALAAPANATQITYTLSGTFGGTINGDRFSAVAQFVGTGDTTNTTNGFGYTQILGVPVSTFKGLSGGLSFDITTPSFFYIYGADLFGTANGARLGFGFDGTGSNALGIESLAFNGYDGVSSFTATAGSAYHQNAFFQSSAGFVTIDSFSNASFSANAVPEPATWAMMMLGFGLVGASVRRRRASVLA